jgi:regulator of cell morphogenesis and NO signaling
MQAYKENTLASIVTNMHQAAAVFEKYQLDFCCKGKRTLQQACEENNIAVEPVLEELIQVSETGSTLHHLLPATMSATQLTDYIILKHHFYVKNAMPVIFNHLAKVAMKHGDRFPFMTMVFQLFGTVQYEMDAHMQKEEQVLFPRIREVEKAIQQNGAIGLSHTGYISQPIQMMEMEHEEAGNLMAEIRRLTNDYTAPEGACTTFRVSLAELKAFEEDLHQHVHLENNILFPAILKLMQ